MSRITRRSYHHGDLRRALLDAAIESIAETGPVALSLRDLARRTGVSHAAPAYHFGDKAGLLAALAADGFDLLADALGQAATKGGLLDIGVAYVRFAVDHPAHFEVMFRPALYSGGAADVVAARGRARAALEAGIRGLPAEQRGGDARATGLAAWSIVHGFASLWLGKAFGGELGADPELAARRIIRLLFD